MGLSTGAGAVPVRAGSLDSRGLLEREQDLALLDELLERARGGAGGVVLITGPAGIGKTSLLDACARAGERRRIVVLRAIGDELLTGSSFAAARELLWPRVQAAGAEVWEGAAGLASPVFRPEGDGGADPALTASVLHGLYWLVAGLAESAPLALLVDDGQWLDHASAGFLVYLARRLVQLPVLLAVAMRGGDAPAGAAPLAPLVELASRELRISPLSADASVALVRRRLGARADHELCRSCYDATGGNPFYLRELTVALENEGERPSVELARSVRELGAGSVGRTVLVRLVRLGSDCERLAQAVAVLGPGCALRHAAALACLERDQAEAAADALRAADLLAAGRALSFIHPIVAEALTAELPPSRLAAMHGRAAKLLVADGAGPERASVHLLSAEPYGDQSVVALLRGGAREALARGAPELAVSYLRRALAEPPAAVSRRDVLLELGRAECLTPSPTDFGALREGLLSSWLEDGYVTATSALCMADRLDAAGQAADAGIGEAQRRGLASMFMQLAVVRAEIAFRVGDLDLAQAYAERALELGRELGTEHVALVQWLPVVLRERGDVDGAVHLAESVDLGAAELNGSFAVVALAHRGCALVAAGDLERGLADLLDADRRMAAAGWQLSVLADWVPSAAVALLGLGRFAEATQLVARELADAVAFGAARRYGIALSLAGRLQDGDEGLAMLREAVAALERTPARLEYARALVNLGEGLRARSRRVEARPVLTQALSIAGACGAGALIERARSELVASGARPRRVALSGPDALTPAELRTARMAAGGLSNREIAQVLFVSAKTVEAQLSQTYAKLSIRSRRELDRALRGRGAEARPVKP